MASKTTVTAKNLEALGVERLAHLLIEVTAGNAVAKRQLRLALAGAEGPREAAREVAKRLASIARSRSFLEWDKLKPLVADLETQRRAIVEQVAPHDPREALVLLWRFMGLASSLFQRCDDSDGVAIDVFRQACADLGEVARTAGPEPEALARQTIEALQDSDYGQYDGLIPIMAPALGPEGIAHLKRLVEDLGRHPVAVPPKAEWRAVGWGRTGATYAHEIDEHARQGTVRMALMHIADVQGDVDAFIALHDPKTLLVPDIAAELAVRLLAAGRAADALDALDRARVDSAPWIPRDWQDARIEALEALGRKDDAQAFRWACFVADLSCDHLRAYLKRLPDFEDTEAEERAMAHAASLADPLAALEFFLNWPAPERAAQLLVARHDRIDGDVYEVLAPLAEALAERHPLAATVALRAMIDFTLNEARSSRYRHAARHLAACADLAGSIGDFAPLDPHERYCSRLKSQHGRKSGFWSLVER